MTNSIEQAQALYRALTNTPTHLTAAPEEVVEALQAGKSQILVEVPWNEVHNGETHERHQVILTRLADRRIYFINALKNSLSAGTVIEGEGRGPQRRVEPTGEESMDMLRFISLFATGGKAMIAD